MLRLFFGDGKIKEQEKVKRLRRWHRRNLVVNWFTQTHTPKL
jgi:hypothetical protein